MSQHNTPEITTGTSEPAYVAARTGAAILDRRGSGRIVVSGADRASYLQGMLTNDIVALQAGHGCYACYLTAQGRMISDMWVYELGDVMLLTLPRTTRETVLAKLDQFIFSEDVQLGDVSETFASVAVLGLQAPRVLAGLVQTVSAEQFSRLPEGGNVRTTVSGEPAIALRVGDLGVPGYELLVAPAQYEAVWQALRTAGAEPLAEAAAETLRVEGGVPRFHQDMDEDTIPLEANIEHRAISLSKGCYVGQEVIIRVLHRGHGRVAKKLVGLSVSGDVVPIVSGVAGAGAGGIIKSGDREIGRVTSAVYSPVCRKPVALGYVHRDFVAPGTELSIDGVPAVVTAVPFVPDSSAA